jgi:transcription initiation factor TFIIH subunit 4
VPAALFRLVSETARAFVLRLVLAPPSTLSEPAVRAWAKAPAHAEAALAQLRQLRLVAFDRRQSPPAVWVHPHLAAAVLSFVLSDKAPGWSVPLPEDLDGDPTEDEIERFGRAQWERLLEFVVACGDVGDGRPRRRPASGVSQLSCETIALLEGAEILRRGRLTSVGFQFLLKDTRAQVWSLLNACLRAPDEAASDAISLVLRASFLLP